MIDVLRTIISQYSTAPTLCGMIVAADAALDPREDIDDFYRSVWLLDTAFGRGLDIWGRIVAAQREFLLAPEIRGEYLGFRQGQLWPFDEAPWYTGQAAVSEIYRLEDPAFRQLILVKALSNISACDAPSLNTVLRALFRDRGECYVNDLGGMQMRLVFKFPLERSEFAIIAKSGYMVRPAGVGMGVLHNAYPCFGFREANRDKSDYNTWDALPFDVGVFLPPGSYMENY